VLTAISWARFAANNALDLISLVLSADPNKRAPASFSATFRDAGLNQGVPFGSFGVSREDHEYHARKEDELKRQEELEKRQELVSKAARMEALDTAADEILKAAKKLEKEVRRETKYWQEIVSISDKGWPIQRLRQNARNMPFGVRYGLPEASDHFKARGFAPLRMDKDGSIILDPNLSLKPKTLRVRISEDGKIVGSSQLPMQGEVTELAVERSVQLARDSLLEEELYHSMSLETRQLLPYGVQLRGSVISVDATGAASVKTDRKLLIDCVPRDEKIPDGQDHSYDWLAQNVAESLRLLLAHEHSMRLYRRSQLPPPLTGRKREEPSPPLLRTLLAMLRHLQSVDSLHAYLGTVAATLDSAGLGVSLDTARETSWTKLGANLRESSKRGLSATDQLLEIFSRPFDGKATMTLPSFTGAQSDSITIVTRTVIGQPTFGTEHKLMLPASLAADLGLFQQSNYPTVEDVASYLDWVLSLHLTHRLLKNEFASTLIKGKDAKVTIACKGSKKGSTTTKDVSVEMKNGHLTAIAMAYGLQQGPEVAQQLQAWNGQSGQVSLHDQVKSWIS
jgi:mediator of RNA polymerase II transcription subunit 17